MMLLCIQSRIGQTSPLVEVILFQPTVHLHFIDICLAIRNVFNPSIERTFLSKEHIEGPTQ